MTQTANVVNDISGLNPVVVWAIALPRSTADVVDAMKRSSGPVSIGGGRCSMGGQVASPASLHLDLRQMNQVLAFSPSDKTIRVQAGIRWRAIQRFIDPHGLSVMVMQAHANFTVGGSLAVNCHGRYVGHGPVVDSVRAIRLVLADGQALECSREANAELFFAAIGGYGAVGVITEVELDLVANHKVERSSRKLKLKNYLTHFRELIRKDKDAVFHHADLYPPHFTRVRSVTWKRSERSATHYQNLHEVDEAYPVHRYFVWALTDTPLAKWRREYVIDPLLYRKREVHWRNYEASYDISELEPGARQQAGYVLQEYFCPAERCEEFVPMLAEILQRHGVESVNVSMRHVNADAHTLLSWARGDSFCFGLYYRPRARDAAGAASLAVWTRELIDAALSVGGSFYLPYQLHATRAQFHAAYPRAQELFALKRRVDPQHRLRNALWDAYYAPTLPSAAPPAEPPRSHFHAVLADVTLADGFYRVAHSLLRRYPADRLQVLLSEACERFAGADDVYRHLLRELPRLEPRFAERRLARPARREQQAEVLRQTVELLGPRKRLAGCIEIGSGGRQLGALRRAVKIGGRMVLAHDVAERRRKFGAGEFVHIGDHEPLGSAFDNAGFDLVTCYGGLHRCPPDKLEDFVASVARVLRPGGLFVLREHDARDEGQRALVATVHALADAAQAVPWDVHAFRRRALAPLSHWITLLERHGLVDSGARLVQRLDATDNVLMAFTKPDEPAADDTPQAQQAAEALERARASAREADAGSEAAAYRTPAASDA